MVKNVADRRSILVIVRTFAVRRAELLDKFASTAFKPASSQDKRTVRIFVAGVSCYALGEIANTITRKVSFRKVVSLGLGVISFTLKGIAKSPQKPKIFGFATNSGKKSRRICVFSHFIVRTFLRINLFLKHFRTGFRKDFETIASQTRTKIIRKNAERDFRDLSDRTEITK